MSRSDLIKVRHLNYFFAGAAAFCVLDAAAQLNDLHLLLVAMAGAIAAYFIGQRRLDGDHALPLRDALILYTISIAMLVACSLVLLAGPDVVGNVKWLFIAQGVAAGFRIKSSD